MPSERTCKRKPRSTRASSSSSVECITSPAHTKSRRNILHPPFATRANGQPIKHEANPHRGSESLNKAIKDEGKRKEVVTSTENQTRVAGLEEDKENDRNDGGRKQRAARNATRDEASVLHDFPNAIRRLDPCSRCVKDGFTCFGPTKANTRCYTCRSLTCNHYTSSKQVDKMADREAKLAERNEIWKQINQFLKLSQQSRGGALDFFLKEIKKLAESIGETVDSVSGGKYEIKNGN